jgi:hypothetical protein
MGYLDKALETMQHQGDRVIDHNLIDTTLKEIGETYRPGLLAWLKEDRGRWHHLLAIEERINDRALVQDEGGLRCALDDYREFFQQMTALYAQGDALPLFERRERT